MILRYEEIINHDVHSHIYEVTFMIRDGEIWREKLEVYSGEEKHQYDAVLRRWEKDYRSHKVRLVAVTDI